MKDTGCIQALDVEWIEIEWPQQHYYHHAQRLYHDESSHQQVLSDLRSISNRRSLTKY